MRPARLSSPSIVLAALALALACVPAEATVRVRPVESTVILEGVVVRDFRSRALQLDFCRAFTGVIDLDARFCKIQRVYRPCRTCYGSCAVRFVVYVPQWIPGGWFLAADRLVAALRDDTRRVLVGQSNTFNAITQVNIDIDVNVNVKQETEIPNPPDLSSIPPAPVEAPPTPGGQGRDEDEGDGSEEVEDEGSEEVSEEGDPPPTPPIPSAVEELGSPLAPEQGSSASGRGEGDDRGDEGDNEGGSEGGGDDDGGDAILGIDQTEDVFGGGDGRDGSGGGVDQGSSDNEGSDAGPKRGGGGGDVIQGGEQTRDIFSSGDDDQRGFGGSGDDGGFGGSSDDSGFGGGGDDVGFSGGGGFGGTGGGGFGGGGKGDGTGGGGSLGGSEGGLGGEGGSFGG